MPAHENIVKTKQAKKREVLRILILFYYLDAKIDKSLQRCNGFKEKEVCRDVGNREFDIYFISILEEQKK